MFGLAALAGCGGGGGSPIPLSQYPSSIAEADCHLLVLCDQFPDQVAVGFAAAYFPVATAPTVWHALGEITSLARQASRSSHSCVASVGESASRELPPGTLVAKPPLLALHPSSPASATRPANPDGWPRIGASA
jgi:hypothetical protein